MLSARACLVKKNVQNLLAHRPSFAPAYLYSSLQVDTAYLSLFTLYMTAFTLAINVFRDHTQNHSDIFLVCYRERNTNQLGPTS